jgi:hypothetical protein
MTNCDKCDGTGIIEVSLRSGLGYSKTECYVCDGKGFTGTKTIIIKEKNPKEPVDLADIINDKNSEIHELKKDLRSMEGTMLLARSEAKMWRDRFITLCRPEDRNKINPLPWKPN